MPSRTIRILTNVRELERVFVDGTLDGTSLEIVAASERDGEFLLQCRRSDLVIIDSDQRKLALACMVRPFSNFRLVSVDLVLRRGTGETARLARIAKRVWLSQVDKFILYFKDIRGYQELYGIGLDRALYVPFKVNGWEQRSFWQNQSPDGDYVLCAGRSLRDVKTFIAAMREAGCPALLLQQKRDLLHAHGTDLYGGELPPNVRRVVDETDELEGFLAFVRRARLVVIPRFSGDIAATGISTYLMAMAMGKCVIISRGPGVEDVLTDQAVMVEPERPEDLASATVRLWHDHDLRAQVALRGLRYAESLAGEQRLWSDVLRESLVALGESPRPPAADRNLPQQLTI